MKLELPGNNPHPGHVRCAGLRPIYVWFSWFNPQLYPIIKFVYCHLMKNADEIRIIRHGQALSPQTQRSLAGWPFRGRSNFMDYYNDGGREILSAFLLLRQIWIFEKWVVMTEPKICQPAAATCFAEWVQFNYEFCSYFDLPNMNIWKVGLLI